MLAINRVLSQFHGGGENCNQRLLHNENLNSDEPDDRQSGRLNGAGDLSVLSKIQKRVLAEDV